MISKDEQRKIERAFRTEAALVATLTGDIFKSAQESLRNLTDSTAGILGVSRGSKFDKPEFLRACGLSFDTETGWYIDQSRPVRMRHIMSGEPLTCGECGGNTFFNLTRTTDYQTIKCATCGHTTQTLTETGACR